MLNIFSLSGCNSCCFSWFHFLCGAVLISLGTIDISCSWMVHVFHVILPLFRVLDDSTDKPKNSVTWFLYTESQCRVRHCCSC